jgi:hypothetical protein
MTLDGSIDWIVQKGSFLAATNGIQLETKTQNLLQGLFSGEGFFVSRVKGTGTLALNSFGSLHEVSLGAGETYVVDNSHLVAWTASTQYKISKAASGWINTITSGEGFVCRFQGPGTILMQTRNPRAFSSWLAVICPPRGVEGPVENSFPATAFLKEPRVASRPARVAFQDGGLLIEADGFSALWPIDTLRFTAGGDEKAYLIVTSPESERLFDSLVVNDPALLEALASRADEKGRLILASFDRGRRKAKRDKWLHMGLFALLALGLLALAFWGIERFLVREVVKRTPIQTEVAWGGKLVGLTRRGGRKSKKAPSRRRDPPRSGNAW